jgi:hypothetical protein
MSARSRALVTLLLIALLPACGTQEETPAPSKPASPPPSKPAPQAPAAAALPEPDTLPNGLVLALAQFVKKEGKPVPGPARLEFLFRKDGRWQTTAVEDADSNVFHKAMVYTGFGEPQLLTMAGTAAIVKTWAMQGDALEATEHWQKNFGGKWSRMRDAEVADLFADGQQSIAIATHDQGVVAVLRPDGETFSVTEIDEEPETFVHEIEIGDLDGDGVLEVYATPSDPNRLDGSVQRGAVVRYVPKTGEGRVTVADMGDRHAKEILVEDVDGDGRDELYVSVEGHLGGADGKTLIHGVEIRRFDADTPADGGVVVGRIDDRLTRFLTAGDLDGDGKKELVAAAFSSGIWLLRPGSDPRGEWKIENIDRDSAGFEHASIITDLDGDGVDELYVASDRHKELRRYRWNGSKLVRDTIYKRPDDRPIFTWNLMPVPVALIPGA